jgi:hypothetical protein
MWDHIRLGTNYPHVTWAHISSGTLSSHHVSSHKARYILSSRHVSSHKAGNTLSSRHVNSCDVNACTWDVRGDLTLNSMAQIHTSVTLLTSRDLAWNSGRLTCQHAYHISAVAHISWDVTYVSSALQTLPVVSRNCGNAYWKVRQLTFLYDTKSPDYKDQHMRANAWDGIGKKLKI